MAARFSVAEVFEATRADLGTSHVPGTPVFEGICTDTRSLSPGALFVALEGERFDAHRFLDAAAAGGAAGAVVRKGWPRPATPEGFALFEVASTRAALGGLARFHRLRFRIPVGAVGGSNGKTTTKEMVGAILDTLGPALRTEGNFNNEVGLPLTLLRLEPSHVAAVVELGMNHEGEMARLTAIAEPNAAMLTVIQAEHLEGLSDLDGVARAEGELFSALSDSAVAVVNADDARIVAQAEGTRARKLTFGTADSAEVRLTSADSRGKSGSRVTVRHAGEDYPFDLHFLGAHNAHNACGAFAMGLALGCSPESCVAGLEAARPYARRLQVHESPSGVTVLDDCYNANPASMRAALETLRSLAGERGRAVAVLGDMLELGPEEAAEHLALGERVGDFAHVVAFFGPRFEKGAAAGSASLEASHFLEVEPLVAWISARLRSGDVVLVKGSRGMRLERVVASLMHQPLESSSQGA